MALSKKPFVILDAEILSSSVWSEAAHVRLVWITLLILCDTDGYVGASVPGIASAAGVTMEQCEEALAKFQAPDRYSRTTANEGRRVELADRGWRVLNFMAHIDRLSSERRKARERVKRHRARKEERIKSAKKAPKGPDPEPPREMPRNAPEGYGNVSVPPENRDEGNRGIGEQGVVEQGVVEQGRVPSTDNNNILAAVGREPVETSQTTAAVRLVFEHWQAVMSKPQAKLTGDRERRIKARLKEGYTVDDLKAAVDGCKASAWHQGANKDGRVYDDLELICRDGKHVEDFKGTATPEPEPRPTPGPAPWERYQ